MIRAVAFDFDGGILANNSVLIEAYPNDYRRHGMPLPDHQPREKTHRAVEPITGP